MVEYLKQGKHEIVGDAADIKVRDTVSGIIDAIRQRGDSAVREYSQSFDKWSPASFRLSAEDLDKIVKSVSPETLDDIRFAQEQVRNFATHQKAALKDIEVE